MALPEHIASLYPGRFLKADLFKGRKVTLTIKNIDIEELQGEKGKESKWSYHLPNDRSTTLCPRHVGSHSSVCSEPSS